tara:strand:+ start:9526 stop:10317 length:792 start_codon:yes stop_codon:yes gene_type:complete
MLIAEIGFNFLGDINLCFKMIDLAKKNKVDAVKFQIWDTKHLVNGEWDSDGRREIYEKAQLSSDKYIQILNYCNNLQIICFASTPTIRDAKNLLSISNKIIKIPSMESHNHDLIDFSLNNFEKVFVSTGALKENELMSLTKYKDQENFYIFHCVSSYPLDLKNFNIGKFFYLKNNFKNFGYSGHYDGIDDAIFAISNGAKLIEKHFTIDKNLPGRDNKFALLPNDFSKIKDFQNSYNKICKLDSLDLLNEEIIVHEKYRGRWG